ncbi:carbohydrate ABC transporter permease [Cohnella candidum]|uniref:Sugar ABC transporter permease n=1 Tax=Cohnella candidum TaxID=2674991 RepID=A0A3G3K320_9BACL|nr:sugar ABC transporter permease [Cohnella candidum]AYQ74914.1 sugar ABC transporter permease [Cohnella candidum]
MNRLLRNPALWFLLPALIIFALLGIYPTLQALWTSFFNYTLTDPTSREFIGLRNYGTVLTDVRFWEALGRSVLFVSVSVSVSFVVGLLVSLMLSKIRHLQTFYQVAFLIPMVISPTVAAYNFKFMYNYNFGIFNRMLSAVGLPKIDFLSNTAYALWSTVLIDIWQWTPLVILILLAGIETLSREPYEAAAIDGARPLRVFCSVTLPMLKPFIVIALLLRLMDSLKVYESIQLVTAGGPGTSSETLNTYLATVGFSWFDMGHGSALGFIAMNITSMLCFILVKYTNTFNGGDRR